MSSDLEFEPIPGLPGRLPPGERILWQGSPRWRALARRAHHLPTLAIYFAVMLGARLAVGLGRGDVVAALPDLAVMLALFALCLGVLAFIAWLQARATVYTITSRRVVMRIGASIAVTWNLPFERLAAADLALPQSTRSEAGDGDIVLRLAPPDRIQWFFFWPHVAPGRLLDPRPALRCIGEPERVAQILASAVSAWAATRERVVVAEPEPVTPERPARGLTLEAHP